MKTIKLALLVLMWGSLSFSQTQTFMLGIAGTYPEGDWYNTTKNTDWSRYPELSLNIWQGFYTSDKQPEILDSCARYNLWAFYNPDTIIWAAFGKMAIHQAEEISDRFSYDNHWCGSNYIDNSQWGSGQLVRKFDINDPQCGNGPSGTVLWNVHEKGFQSYANSDPLHEYFFKDAQGNFIIGKWYVKPRMRIAIADTGGTEKPVVKIIVKAFNGDTVLSRIITNKNFRFPDGTYDGSYLEEYKNLQMWVSADSINRGRPEPSGNWSVIWTGWDTCKVDYHIYWYGQVNVWIDYVKVMNRQAHILFDQGQEGQHMRDRIYQKANTLVTHTGSQWMKGFYTEEMDYSDITCMKALNDSLAAWFPNDRDKVHIYGLINYETYSFCVRSKNGNEVQDYLSAVQPPIFMSIQYPFGGEPWNTKLPENVDFYNSGYSDGIIAYEQPRINDMKVDYVAYNNYLQGVLQIEADTQYYMYSKAKLNGLRFIEEPHICQWGGTPYQGQREPMNSEIGAQIGIAMCRGAQGIMPFFFMTFMSCGTNDTPMCFGMTDVSHSGGSCWGDLRRDYNFYGEPKWNYVRDLYAKIRNYWGPIAANSINTLGYSVYRDGADHEYLTDIQSIVPGLSGQNPCIQGLPAGPYLDCPYERYWELGFFNMASEGYERYFMLTNRRCIPDGGGYTYDNRVLKISFNADNLPGSFDNWKLTGVGEDNPPAYFHRNYEGYVDLGSTQGSLGWFKPGESKLFKIEPVIKGGGTLIADEVIEDQNFTCEDTVWNDGYDITITGSSDVNFSDSATIIMEDGTFQSGDASGGPISNKITYTSSVSGHKWGGLRFYDANVKIYNSEFKEIASPAGGGFAIQSVDCPLNDIRYNIFTSSTDTAGGVNIAYVNYSPFGAPPNSYVMYNNFVLNNSYSRAVQVQGFAGLTEGVYVKGNTMTSNGYATGIFLSTVTGGVIKNNNISGFETAINTMSSTCDFYGNTISNNVLQSKGIYAVESSVLNLAPSGSQWTGGMNNISNMKDYSINLNIDASNFLLMGGTNAFDLLSTATEPYHLYGSFVSESYNSNATGNCFKLSGTEINDPELPNNYLTNGYEQVTLDFISYNCSQSMPECSDIVSIGNGLYDTIPRMCGGGGAESNSKLKIKNEKFILTPRQLQDSIKIQMRHRNYARVKILCNELIGNYPESMESISLLQTLYMATVLSDTTTSSRSALKAFYEGLILNHGNNEGLVNVSNYLVQKCKVLLRQYTSALAGFQAIINNNQYNYRGLLARWDYMATSLLMQGQGGGEKTIKNYELGIINSEAEVTDEELALLDGYDKFGDDKNPYSKEERVAIQKNVRTVNEKSKNIGEKRIEILQRAARQNNQRAKNELQRINTMKQLIKTEKPKNVIEHIKIVNNDIQTVFGSTLSNKSTAINNIPSVYRLAQNYPNPFNPVTTIKYELPKDSKVKLVVFDLLGREVKTLVNEIKSVGYYQTEFNMQNYASGVYFYRIEADDLGGKKFIDAKKMVLVK